MPDYIVRYNGGGALDNIPCKDQPWEEFKKNAALCVLGILGERGPLFTKEEIVPPVPIISIPVQPVPVETDPAPANEFNAPTPDPTPTNESGYATIGVPLSDGTFSYSVAPLVSSNDPIPEITSPDPVVPTLSEATQEINPEIVPTEPGPASQEAQQENPVVETPEETTPETVEPAPAGEEITPAPEETPTTEEPTPETFI